VTVFLFCSIASMTAVCGRVISAGTPTTWGFSGSYRGPSAVDDKGLPGHVAGGAGGEEEQRAVEFVGLRSAAEQRVVADGLREGGVGQEPGQLGGEVAGREGIDPHAVLAPDRGEVPGEVDQGSLGGVVGSHRAAGGDDAV